MTDIRRLIHQVGSRADDGDRAAAELVLAGAEAVVPILEGSAPRRWKP
jgi:hypothetical protein